MGHYLVHMVILIYLHSNGRAYEARRIIRYVQALLIAAQRA